jgi:hypothetical protein
MVPPCARQCRFTAEWLQGETRGADGGCQKENTYLPRRAGKELSDSPPEIQFSRPPPGARLMQVRRAGGNPTWDDPVARGRATRARSVSCAWSGRPTQEGIPAGPITLGFRSLKTQIASVGSTDDLLTLS